MEKKTGYDAVVFDMDGVIFDSERAYAIEDSYNGIRAAHAGHLLPIMVPDLLPANEEMQEKAEVVLPDLFEVIAYLKGEGAC